VPTVNAAERGSGGRGAFFPPPPPPLVPRSASSQGATLWSLVLTPVCSSPQLLEAAMSSQTMQRQAPSPDLARMASGDNNYPIARPSLNAWISAVMTQHSGGAVSGWGNVVGSPSNSAFAAPAPRKPSSGVGSPVVAFKLSEVDPAQQRSVPTPRSFLPNAHSAALSAGGSLCASAAGGGGGGFAASPPCSQQRSMLGPDDRRPSEESMPGAFTPWQQPRQVCPQPRSRLLLYRTCVFSRKLHLRPWSSELCTDCGRCGGILDEVDVAACFMGCACLAVQARSRPSSQRASVNSRAFQRQRSPPSPVPEGSLLDVLATVCAVKGAWRSHKEEVPLHDHVASWQLMAASKHAVELAHASMPENSAQLT